jgi:hypothetical protein
MRRNATRDRGEWIWALASAAVLSAVVIVPLYWLRGMFGGTEAILAFVGVLVTAAVSMIGFMMTRQSNRRLIDESERAEQRFRQEHDDEQRRLKLDAAMQAGALFAPSGHSWWTSGRATRQAFRPKQRSW